MVNNIQEWYDCTQRIVDIEEDILISPDEFLASVGMLEMEIDE